MNVDWNDLLAAVALWLVLEGLLPLLNPAGLRSAIASMLELSDRVLRGIGLASIIAGLLLLQLVRG